MIAGCIDRMRNQACGTCERRDTCSFVVPELLGALFAPRAAPPKAAPSAPPLGRMLAELIGRAAKAAQARAASVGASRPTSAQPAVDAPASGLRLQVEQAVESFLAEGPVRIDSVARRLGYSRQTLYRRLKAQGITFERLVDDLRHRRAVELVRAGRLSIKEISHRLGFSDPAAFSRAFKRWTGSSPRTMRGQPG